MIDRRAKWAWALGLTVLAVLPAACEQASGSTGADQKAADSEGAIGVVECDDYLTKYHSCVSTHVAAPNRKAFEGNLSRTRAAWKAMAASPGARGGLSQACRVALSTAKKTMQEYNCSW